MFKYYKRNVVLGCLCVSILLPVPVLATSDATWLRYAQVCSPDNELCVTQSERSALTTVSLNDLADVAYLSSYSNGDSLAIFSFVDSIYQELVQQSQSVSQSDLNHVTTSVQRDFDARSQLYQDIKNTTLTHGAQYLHRDELRHYYKEFKYLTALIEEQQRQIDIVAKIQTSDERLVKLKVALEKQCFDIDMSINFIKAQLEHDMQLDQKLIQYFQYKQRQHQGV
ncbi:TPA: hypothetical protein ACGTRQ_003801 [Vibrio parahaemolyticus]